MDASHPVSILVVGSNANALPRLCKDLRAAGYQAIGCADADRAVQLIDRQPVDALVLDEGSSRTGGRRLTEHLRRTQPLSYVILTRRPSDVVNAVNHVFTANEN